MLQVKALISLQVCAGWSEPLLVAHTTLLEISCHSSNQLTNKSEQEQKLWDIIT